MPALLRILPVMLLSLTACSQHTTADEAAPSRTADSATDTATDASGSKKMNVQKTITGTLVYKTIEGGFYGFVADNGKHYTLRNLAPEHKKNGMQLTVTGRIRNDVMTFTQFGEVFDVETVDSLDASHVKPADNTF